MNNESCCHVDLDVSCCGTAWPNHFPMHQMTHKSERTCHQNGSKSSFSHALTSRYLHLSTMYRQRGYFVAMYAYIVLINKRIVICTCAIEVNVTRSTSHQLQQWQRKDRNLFRAIAKSGFDSAHPCGAPNVAETSIYGDTMHA